MASSRHSSFTNTYITETKRTVVVDIGSRFVKCGYASEGYPRNIFVAPKKWHNYGAILERSEEFKTINYKEWCEHLGYIFRRIFYRTLQCKPQDVKVIVCEQFTSTISFRRACAYVLLNQFQVNSIHFSDSLMSSVYVTGSDTGIVIDIGYSETRIGLVISGFICSNAYFDIGTGTKNVLIYLNEVLKIEFEKSHGVNTYTAISKESLEEILAQSCFCIPLNKDQDQVPKGIDVFKVVDVNGNICNVKLSGDVRSSIVNEIFFPTSDNSYSKNEVDNHEDENSHKRQPPSEDDLIGIFFKLLKFCPTDHRVNAIQNVLLCGGLASIPGFGFRFLQELKQVIAYFPTRYNMYKTCVDNLHITNTKVPTISIAWTGASILGSLKLRNKTMYDLKSLTRKAGDSSSSYALVTKSSEVAVKDTLNNNKELKGNKEIERIPVNNFTNVFDPSLLTREECSSAYLKWKHELLQRTKSIEDITSSPEKKANTIGTALALFAAARWRRKVVNKYST